MLQPFYEDCLPTAYSSHPSSHPITEFPRWDALLIFSSVSCNRPSRSTQYLSAGIGHQNHRFMLIMKLKDITSNSSRPHPRTFRTPLHGP